MSDGATTRRRNCKNRRKREWYAVYRSARFRCRFGALQLTNTAAIETALERFRSHNISIEHVVSSDE